MFSSRHPEDHFRLRMHRARSVDLTNEELVELRAAQRTFEGAYVRTALSQLSFALVVLKIFTSEFYSIGALFAAYAFCLLLVSAYRRQQGNKQFFTELNDDGMATKRFVTSGNVVVAVTALTIAAIVSGIFFAVRGLVATLGKTPTSPLEYRSAGTSLGFKAARRI